MLQNSAVFENQGSEVDDKFILCCSDLFMEHLEQGVRGPLTFREKLTLKEL